jgi:hypothetical protein
MADLADKMNVTYGVFEKTCPKCGISKPKTDFFKCSNTSDGLHSWCKSCCKEQNQVSKQKLVSTIEGRAKVFVVSCRASARRRNQECSITEADILQMWSEQYGICAYSGREMTLMPSKLNTVSVERIDSNVGYTPENTILVCQAVNRMKSDFALDDFLALCRDIAEFTASEDEDGIK